jgi:hypothetical protein
MNRRQRAIACAVGIIPTTLSNVALLQCGRPGLAWLLELAVGAGYYLWIFWAP